ncbi:MAG: NADP oxidoreductase, partial [Chloroflexota bacterium]|nr:NADP oxidoreductase [Chloroflexota bacterium]
LMDRAYRENVTLNPQVPTQWVPALLPISEPINRVVPVDIFLPGCPPHADIIFTLLDDLLSGRTPAVAGARFGR